MTEKEAYVAFNLTENVGFATVDKLVQSVGSAVEAWQRWPKKISRTGGEVDWKREFDLAKRHNVEILTLADEDYPAILANTPARPLALYVRGDVKALSKPSIAMVGTRRATSYGLNMADKLSYDLAKAGWSIVSGLALGIDAQSHKGALEASGITVGVLGSGLDCFYPEQNIPLAREIVANGGAVISEFAFGRNPDRETFPIRNHVVAGLSRGVIAVEASLKSGTLITTSIAADLGRTVMAVPGRADSRSSAGCLKLIREGAILVRDADDVLEAMSELFPNKVKKDEESCDSKAVDPDQPPYTVEEALVMLHVDADGVSLEKIASLTGLGVLKVNSLAMTLRIKGFVRFLPGNRIALSRPVR